MKRTIAVGLMMFVAAAAIFANGVPEGVAPGRGDSWAQEPVDVSLAGTYVEDETGTYLETADGVYTLSAPGYRRQAVDLESGDSLAVEGLLVEPCAECSRDSDGHVMVQSATVDGKTYEVSRGPWDGPRRPGFGSRTQGTPRVSRNDFGRSGCMARSMGPQSQRGRQWNNQGQGPRRF